MKSFINLILLGLLANVNGTGEKNVLETPLELCSDDPLTGYTRTGYCETNQYDQGTHLICATVTGAFLEYTKSLGNDLSTPRSSFPGWLIFNGLFLRCLVK